MSKIEDKRLAILEGMLRLVSKNGFHGTAMSKVAKESKVSTGIIYHYFDSKDQLIDELYKHVKRNFSRAVLEEFDETVPLAMQIRQILRSVLKHYMAHPLDAAFVEQYMKSPYYRPEIRDEVTQYYMPMVEALTRAKQEMVLKDLPAAVMKTITIDVMISLAQQHAAGLFEITDELIEQIVDALWEAIRR